VPGTRLVAPTRQPLAVRLARPRGARVAIRRAHVVGTAHTEERHTRALSRVGGHARVPRFLAVL
jgi:hypothetical protein